MSRRKAELLEAEVVRLQRELVLLEQQWKKKHWLALFVVAAIPAFFVFGRLVAGIVVLCTPALVATQAYLLAVRRTECRQLIEEAKRELALLEPPPQVEAAAG
jgi:hypothetical protein